MPDLFPATPKPASVKRMSNAATQVSYSQSLIRRSTSFGGQTWSFSISYPPMTESTAQPLWSFIVALGGRLTSFYYTDPSYTGPQGAVTGNIAVGTAGAAQGATSVPMSGFAVSTAYVFKAGDLVKFSSHDKVYMVTANASSDGAGAATVSIYPQLVAAVSSGATVYYTQSDLKYLCAMSSDQANLPISTALFHRLDLEIEEVL